jgi:hypothetical protein
MMNLCSWNIIHTLLYLAWLQGEHTTCRSFIWADTCPLY